MSKIIIKLKYDTPNNVFKGATTGKVGVKRLDYIAKQLETENDIKYKTEELLKNEQEYVKMLESEEQDQNEESKFPEIVTDLKKTKYNEMSNSSVYTSYISQRKGSTGLFDEKGNIDLKTSQDKIKDFEAEIYRTIISLREEDAIEKGLKTKSDWQKFAKQEVPKFLKDIGLKSNECNWYGAFHNKKGHPHMHIVFYEPDKKYISKNPKIDKEKLNIARTNMVKRVFKKEYEEAIELKNKTRKIGVTGIKGYLETNLYTEVTRKNDVQKDFNTIIQHLEKNIGRGRYNYEFLPSETKEYIDIEYQKLLQNDELKQQKKKYLESIKELQSLYQETEKENQNTEYLKALKNAENDYDKRIKNAILLSVKQYSKYQYSNKIKYKEKEINRALEKISKSTIIPLFNEVDMEEAAKIKEIINKTKEINNNEKRILNNKKLIMFKKELQYLKFSKEEITKQIEKSVPELDQIAQIKKQLEQRNIIKNNKVTEEIVKYKNLTKLDKQIIKLLENKENQYTIKKIFKEIKDIPKQKKDYTNLVTLDYFTLKLYKKQNIYKLNKLTEYQKERISILKSKKMIEIEINQEKKEIKIINTKDLENKFKEPKYIFSKGERDLAIEYFRRKKENIDKEKSDIQIIKLLETKENDNNNENQRRREIQNINFNDLLVSDYFTLNLNEKKNIYGKNELTEYQKQRIKILEKNELIVIRDLKEKNQIRIINRADLKNKLKEPKYSFSEKEEKLTIDYFRRKEGVKFENFKRNFVGKNKDYNFKNFKNKIENITSYLKNENKDFEYVINQLSEEINEEYAYLNNRINYLKDIKILEDSDSLSVNESTLEEITKIKLNISKERIENNYQEELSELEQDFINYIDKGNGKIEMNEFIDQQKKYINYLNKETKIEGADQKSEFMKYCEIKNDNIPKTTLETIVKLNAITNVKSEVEIKKIMNEYAKKISVTNIKITENDIENIYISTQKSVQYLKETNQKIIISKKEFELVKDQFNKLGNIKYSEIYDYSKLFKNNLYNESLNASIIAGKKEEKRIENLAKKLDQERSNTTKIVAGFDKVDILGF